MSTDNHWNASARALLERELQRNGLAEAAPDAAVEEVAALMARITDFSAGRDRFGRAIERPGADGAYGGGDGWALAERPRLDAILREVLGREPVLRPALHLTHDLDRVCEPPRFMWEKLERRALGVTLRLRLSDAKELRRKVMAAQKLDHGASVEAMLAAGAGVKRTVYVSHVGVDEFDADPIHETGAFHVTLRAVRDGVVLGLHPGFTINDAAALAEGRATLERVYGVAVDRVRYHYLRIAYPECFADMATAGFRFDSSVGYSFGSGARHGLHLPFEVAGGLREWPLLLMDSSLPKDDAAALAAIDRTLEQVAACGMRGCALFHNGERAPGQIRHFVARCGELGIELVDGVEL